MLKRLLILLLLIAGLLAVAAWEVKQRWEAPLAIDADGYQLTVAPGQSLRGLAQILQREGVYPSPWLLRLYGRWSGLDQQIKRGEYLVPQGTTADGLLLLLRNGKVISYQVTLPEGITLARALEVLADDGRLAQSLSGKNDPRLAEFSAGHVNGEGLFFPDSYQFERGATDLDVLQRAYNAMQQVLAEEWRDRAPGPAKRPRLHGQPPEDRLNNHRNSGSPNNGTPALTERNIQFDAAPVAARELSGAEAGLGGRSGPPGARRGGRIDRSRGVAQGADQDGAGDRT